jgi:hypothetical protein
VWNGLDIALIRHFGINSVSRSAYFASGALRIRNLFYLCDGRGSDEAANLDRSCPCASSQRGAR